MYLREVEDPGSARGVYISILRQMQAGGGPISQIWHLFAYKPEATDHLLRFTQTVMRGPSPLSAGLRELIGAYTSASNQCSYCRNSHGAAAAELLSNDAAVRAALDNLDTAPLSEPEKALLRFARKTTLASREITQSDIDSLKEHGWSDEAIYDAISVCALFNFYNRWVHASGVHTLPDEAHRQRGRSLAEHGYLLQVGLPPGGGEPSPQK
jgi:uncharacterized peroxidase-related enzyme